MWRLIMLVICVMLCGFKISQETDKFDGSTTVYMDDSAMAKTKQKAMLYFSPYKFISKENETAYFLTVYYLADDWAFIQPKGNSLLLLVDGNLTELTAVYGKQEVSNGVIEMVNYLISTDDLLAISKAQKVEFRLLGTQNNVEGEFGKELVKQFGEFCKYCEITSEVNSKPPEISEQNNKQIEITLTKPSQ